MKNLMLTLLMLNATSHMAISKTEKQVHKIPVEAGVSIHAEDCPGEGVPFVLMHGFPDNKVIYQKLVAELTAGGADASYLISSAGETPIPRGAEIIPIL